MNARTIVLAMMGFPSLLCCLALVRSDPSADSPEIDDATVIAVVNSQPITYSAIKVSPEAATRRFVFENKREPVTETDSCELERLRHVWEVKQLVRHIRIAIRKEQIARLGVTASEGQIQARWEELVSESDPPARQAANRAKIAALLEALRAVYERSADSEEVYKSQLASTMSRHEWEVSLRQYRTSDSRALLKDALKDDRTFDQDARAAARQVVIMEKLRKAVEEDLVRTDREFAEHARLAAIDPRNEKVQGKGPLYRDAKRYEWWQERYREAKVEIKHDQFKGAWKEPFE